MKNSKIITAVAHVASEYLNLEKTLEKSMSLIKEAAGNNAQIIIFPEAFLPGFPYWNAINSPLQNHQLFLKLYENSISIDSIEIKKLKKIAKENNIIVSMGFNEKSPASNGTLWNSNIIISENGNILNHHRKIVPTFYEKLTWSNGDGAGLKVKKTTIGNIGMLICGENTNSLAKYSLIAQGEQIHISSYPAKWPTQTSKSGQYNLETTIKMRAGAHAFEGKVFNLVASGFIDKTTYILAIDEPIGLVENSSKSELKANYVAEMVRKALYEEFGNNVYTSGLKVYTTIRKKNQRAANRAIQNGIINYMNRHDLKPPEGYVELNAKDFKDDKERNIYLKQQLRLYPTFDKFIPGVVLKTQPLKLEAYLKNGKKINVYKSGLKLLKKDLNIEVEGQRLVKPGSILRFIRKNNTWIATQLPEVESALVSIDPQTGAVLALVGGFNFYRNKYNHITQAQRQPGSIFKPFIYSAALEKGITPATLVNDASIYITADELGSNENWEPQNYNNKFLGAIRLREGLAKSKNLVAIRVLKHIGPTYALDYISKFGFNPKKHNPYLSMALGVGEVSALEMVAAYGVFANGGYLKKPYFIDRIIDAKGRKIKQSSSVMNEETPRVIDPRNAFIMHDLLKEVIKSGTARRAKNLKRPDIAGKTGTTNDLLDAWFAGFNPDIVTVTWMGYDQPKPLGKLETGSRAALPIWIDYMRPILNDYPIKGMSEPDGIIPLKINTKNGMLAKENEDGIYEYFYDEYTPSSNAYFLIN